MFIEKLKISTKNQTIREMNFHRGMNLIIDNTPLTDNLKLTGKNAIRKINGKSMAKKDFENELLEKIFPEHKNEKPSFKQIISHNIRYNDNSINKTLKTLNSFTSDVEYETLYLYLLGCGFDSGAKKQALTYQMNQEIAYKERIEKNKRRIHMR